MRSGGRGVRGEGALGTMQWLGTCPTKTLGRRTRLQGYHPKVGRCMRQHKEAVTMETSRHFAGFVCALRQARCASSLLALSV